MPMIKACCCWDTLRQGSKGSAVLTFVVGFINFIIDIWGVVFLHGLDRSLEDHEKYTWLMPGIIVFMYIELAFSVGMMILAFVLNIGINQGMEGKALIRTWTYGVIVARVYELLLGIYVISWLGGFRIPDIVYMAPETNLLIAYWILANILLIAAIICVRSYWQELLDHVYGKERRTKYFSVLSNIRTANRDRTGTVTPMSYWSRSRAPSHMSLAQPHSQSYGNPAFSHHPSQSSYQPPSHHASVSSYQPPSHHPSQSSYQPSVHYPQPHHHTSQSSYNSAAAGYAPQQYKR